MCTILNSHREYEELRFGAMKSYLQTKICEIDDEEFRALISEIYQGVGWPLRILLMTRCRSY